MKYLIFTENENSKWNDVTGVHYHFPYAKYKSLILEGSRFIYYKGSIQNGKKAIPYYFGTGIVGPISRDPQDPKSAYCRIINYQAFTPPIPFKLNEAHLEETQGKENYWRDGAREISEAVFHRILSLTHTAPFALTEEEHFQEAVKASLLQDEQALRTLVHGNEHPFRYSATTTVFKRNPAVAALALQRAKGQCERCKQPAPFHRPDGRPFLEIHHIHPLAEGGADTLPNIIALCPNCHRYLHYASDAREARTELIERIGVQV